MDGINLKEQFGGQFKVVFEESYYAERSKRTVEDPRLLIIPCANGFICPWSGSNLAACTSRAGPVARKLKGLPFTEVAQDGDDGANVVFDVAHFDEVARIMRPRLRRRLAEVHKAAAAARLRQYRAAKAPIALEAPRQGAESGVESPPVTMPV